MSSKRFIAVFGIFAVVAFGYIGYKSALSTWQHLQDQKNQIEQLNSKYHKLDKELDEAKKTKQQSQEEVQRLEEEKKRLEEEGQRLKSELQAKAEAKARLAAASRKVIDTATNTQTASASGGDIVSIITASSNRHGVDPSYMVKVANCESTLNPAAVNRGYYAGGGNPSGLYQYLPETWSRISSRSPYGAQPWSEVFNAHTNSNVTAWAFANGYSGEWACA